MDTQTVLVASVWDREESDVATVGLSAMPTGHRLEGG